MSKQSIRNQLKQFREQIEMEAQAPISQVESPMALVLSDICNAFRLRHKDRNKVLGKHGSQFVKMTNEANVGIPTVVLKVKPLRDRK
jgi:hypothetical protein